MPLSIFMRETQTPFSRSAHTYLIARPGKLVRVHHGIASMASVSIMIIPGGLFTLTWELVFATSVAGSCLIAAFTVGASVGEVRLCFSSQNNKTSIVCVLQTKLRQIRTRGYAVMRHPGESRSERSKS